MKIEQNGVTYNIRKGSKIKFKCSKDNCEVRLIDARAIAGHSGMKATLKSVWHIRSCYNRSDVCRLYLAEDYCITHVWHCGEWREIEWFSVPKTVAVKIKEMAYSRTKKCRSIFCEKAWQKEEEDNA